MQFTFGFYSVTCPFNFLFHIEEFILKHFRFKSSTTAAVRAGLCIGLMSLVGLQAAQAQEKFTYMTNWYAQAEHVVFIKLLPLAFTKSMAWMSPSKWGDPKSTSCN
jgi:hypothetical protein